MTCKEHPEYQAKYPPQAKCMKCVFIYLMEKYNLNHFERTQLSEILLKEDVM